MRLRGDFPLLLIEAARANVLPLLLVGLLLLELPSNECPVWAERPMWIAEQPSRLVEPPHTEIGEPMPPASHFDEEFQIGPTMPFVSSYDGAADVAVRRRPITGWLVGGFATNPLLPLEHQEHRNRLVAEVIASASRDGTL